MSVIYTKSEYFTHLKDLITGNRFDGGEAANAIRKTINALVDCDLCSLDEFLCLVDLDYKRDWSTIAGEIARKAEQNIKAGLLHPNELKPWQNCPNYPVEFERIATQKEWRELHSALDAIVQSVNKRFQCGS